MSLWQLLPATFALPAAAMLVLWLLSIRWRNVSIVDPFWGTGFVVVAWFTWLVSDDHSARGTVLVLLTTLWGLRLSLHLLWRNWGTEEDRRYAAMREQNEYTFWWRSLFVVFLLQALILWFVSLPLQVAINFARDTPLHWLDILGGALWMLGFVFETVGDWQLARFKADPQNAKRVMDRGLWRFTRHPNYFGDFCVWWGLYLIATAGEGGATIASPIVMSILLMKFSGVGPLESTMKDRRPEYAAYQARTSAFFPGPPRAR